MAMHKGIRLTVNVPAGQIFNMTSLHLHYLVKMNQDDEIIEIISEDGTSIQIKAEAIEEWEEEEVSS